MEVHHLYVYGPATEQNSSNRVIQCRQLIPALNAWAVRALYTTVHPIAPIFLDMHALMISKLNAALIRKLRGSLMCLAYFFDN